MATSDGIHSRVGGGLAHIGHSAMLSVSMDCPQMVRLLCQLVNLLMVVIAEHDTQFLRKMVQEVEGKEFLRLFTGRTQLQHVGKEF